MSFISPQPTPNLSRWRQTESLISAQPINGLSSAQSASYFVVVDDIFLSLEELAQCTLKGNREDLQTFILKYPRVIPYLQQAPNALREQFGKASLSLELRIDPEIEDDPDTLVMNADVAMDVAEGVEKFTEFAEGWLFDVVGEDIDIFMVDVHFV